MLSALRKYIFDLRKVGVPKDPRLLLWDFNDPEVVDNWSCTNDSDLGGYSEATFQHSSKGYATFRGNLSTKLGPEMMYSGYAAIRSKPLKKTMFVSGRIDLSEYDALELCIHGDGRPYIVNIQSPGLARKDDLWQTIMYTRGGVIWENIILPFSEFLLTHRGYLQDHQMTLPRQNISTVGLLLADRTEGPFELNIKYINAIQTLTKIATI